MLPRSGSLGNEPGVRFVVGEGGAGCPYPAFTLRDGGGAVHSLLGTPNILSRWRTAGSVQLKTGAVLIRRLSLMLRTLLTILMSVLLAAWSPLSCCQAALALGVRCGIGSVELARGADGHAALAIHEVKVSKSDGCCKRCGEPRSSREDDSRQGGGEDGYLDVEQDSWLQENGCGDEDRGSPCGECAPCEGFGAGRVAAVEAPIVNFHEFVELLSTTYVMFAWQPRAAKVADVSTRGGETSPGLARANRVMLCWHCALVV